MSNHTMDCKSRSILRSFLLATSILVLVFSVGSVYASAYSSLSFEPRITVNSPPLFLQQGTAGSSLIYTNNTSAKVSTAAPAPTPTYYPNSYNVATGTYLSGSVPGSVNATDSNYFIVRSSVTTNTTNTYNPSGYSPLQSTKYVSGSTTNLQSNDANYMTFRSYVSASSATAKTDAFIAYRDSTTSLNTPKERTWTGDTATWGSQSEMSTAGSPVRFVRVAYSPIEQRSFEKIVVTLSDDGNLDAYVWDGTSWTVTSNIGYVGTTANAYKCFDIAYEKTSGDALLVYPVPGAAAFNMRYRTWSFGVGWSAPSVYTVSLVAQDAYWVSIATKPTSGANEIAVAVMGSASDAYGLIWNGASFSSQQLLTNSASIETEESIAVAYEQTSGYATFVSSTGNNAFSWQWSGSAWDASATTFDLTGASTPNWFTLKPNPINDELFAVTVDQAQDLNTAYWSGSAWTLHTEHDGAVDTDAQRPADFAWEPTGSKGLLVWGTTAGQISYKTFTAPNTWGTQQNPSMGTNVHPWVQLRTNPRSITGDVKILGAVLEDTVFDIGSVSWNGTTFTVVGTNTISSDTTVITYESFEMEFMRFGPPTEYTSEIEFTGTSNTQSWLQLTWTIDSSFTTASTNATFQLYNYQTGNYSTSGDGYMNDIIGTTDVKKNQNITTNPTYFRDASGNWKIKIKGVKTIANQFDFKADWIEFKSIYMEYKVSTEFLFSSMTTNTPTQLNFTVVSEYSISSVNVTIQVWNYTSSAYVTSGQGYLTYTSSGVNETKLLSIYTSPQIYTSNGNARINITGVLSTTTQYQQKANQVKLVYSYSSSSSYNYVLNIVNQVSEPWKIRLSAYSQSNIGRLNNCTIYFRNASDGTSRQIYIADGAYVDQTGPWYDLPGSVGAERYIAVTLQSSDSEVSYIYVYLEILIPNKTTYAQYIITFEIT